MLIIRGVVSNGPRQLNFSARTRTCLSQDAGHGAAERTNVAGCYLYQRPDASIDAHHTLAEAAKLVPKGVICLTSALAYHELTDQIPAKVWIAIGSKDWRPKFPYPAARFARFPSNHLRTGVERHVIDGVDVPIFGIAKTIADLFRYRRIIGINVALEGLREALRKRKATPAQIARYASDARVWKIMEPYVNALTSDG